MPYTVKATTSWADTALAVEDQAANVKNLYTHEFKDYSDLAAVRALRRANTENGNLLARGVILAIDGLSLTVTNVWKSQAVYEAFSNDPIMLGYKEAMRTAGWNTVFTIV